MNFNKGNYCLFDAKQLMLETPLKSEKTIFRQINRLSKNRILNSMNLQIILSGLVFSLNAFTVFGQKMEDLKDVKVTDSIYTFVDEDASFPGGQTELLKFIRENLVYPSNYVEMDCDGRIIVKFVVGKNGECWGFEILRGIIGCPEFDRSAFQMLKKMPKWIPAKINGNAVDSRYVVPIIIDFD